MMAPTFLNVGSTTGCTLADLKVTGYDSAEMNEDDEWEGGCAHGDFVVQFLNPNGTVADRYYWVDDGETGPAWCNRQGVEIDASKVAIPAGAATWVIGSGMTLQSAGQVNAKDIAFIANVSRNTAMGNATPVDLTLADLTVTGYDSAEMNEDDEWEGGCAHGDFVVQFLNPNGTVADRYYWVDDGETGPAWCNRQGVEIDASKIAIPAGKGMWVIGSGMTLNIPSPISDVK